MNKNMKMLVLAGLGLLAVALVVMIVVLKNDTTPDNTATTAGVNGQQYGDFNQSDFEAAADQQRWLFFYASWCPKCVTLDKDINNHLGDIPSDLVIFKVDYDNSQALKQRYGVTIQTTVVAVDSQAKELQKFVGQGGNSLAELIEELYIANEAKQATNSHGASNTPLKPLNQPAGAEPSTNSTPVRVMPGQYLDFNQSDFEATADQQRWLFFYASWCPKCVTLDKDINNHLGDIPSDLVIFKVDYDNSQALKQRYGVTIQTTVVAVDSQAKELQKFVGQGGNSLAELIEELD